MEEGIEFKLPQVTVKNFADGIGKSTQIKPLFKLKISDLLEIPFNEETNTFIFRNNQVNLVMFGGRIENICRDDILFSFSVSDEKGTIQCYYKAKEDTNSLIAEMNRLLDNKLSKIDRIHSQSEEVTMFDSTAEDSILDSCNAQSNEGTKEVLSWFKNEIIAKQKIKEVGDIVHVTGHLCESDSLRKINVLDFRIIENLEEHQDFLLEVEYMYCCLY